MPACGKQDFVRFGNNADRIGRQCGDKLAVLDLLGGQLVSESIDTDLACRDIKRSAVVNKHARQ